MQYLILLLLTILAGCGKDYDPRNDVYTRGAARVRLPALPTSAENIYLFDGGTFNGSIKYLSFDCGSLDDCWQAIAALGGPKQGEFHPWKPSRYAVVMRGPAFYWPQLATPLWDVQKIKKGASHECVDRDRSMDFFAIDFDSLRVYYHHESGGFSTQEYKP